MKDFDRQLLAVAAIAVVAVFVGLAFSTAIVVLVLRALGVEV